MKTSELLKRPEWYSAMYSLAAHRSHAALEDKSGDLELARKEALQLAIGCAAMISESHEDKWLDAFKQLDTNPDEPTPAPSASPSRLPKRYAVRHRRKDNRDRFRQYLRDTVEPSALVLLAGILAAQRQVEASQPTALEPGKLLPALVKAVKKPESLSGEQLVKTVAQRKGLDGRAHYNLACYYAQTAAGDKQRLAEARDQLTSAVRSTFGTQRRILQQWASKDPSLQAAISGWDDADRILASPAATGKHKPELERIVAIGGYAAALAKLDIHTPEALLARLQTPRGIRELAVALDIAPETAAHWRGLLRLLAIEGIGPGQVNLLEAAGIAQPSGLATTSAHQLHERLLEVNTARRIVHAVPSEKTLEKWRRVS